MKKKPTFHVHFSDHHPEEPGLWLSRHLNGYIAVMEVSEADIQRDQRQGNWLSGSWGARLEIVNANVVPLHKKSTLDWVDSAITAHHKTGHREAVAALQEFRLAFFGEELELPEDASVAQEAEQDSLKVPVAGSSPAGSATVSKPGDWEKCVMEHGFESMQEFNSLVAAADIGTPERMAAFLQWRNHDGTKAGLLKLPSR